MSNTMHQLSYSNDLFLSTPFPVRMKVLCTPATHHWNVLPEFVRAPCSIPILDPGIILDVHVKDEQTAISISRCRPPTRD